MNRFPSLFQRQAVVRAAQSISGLYSETAVKNDSSCLVRSLYEYSLFSTSAAAPRGNVSSAVATQGADTLASFVSAQASSAPAPAAAPAGAAAGQPLPASPSYAPPPYAPASGSSSDPEAPSRHNEFPHPSFPSISPVRDAGPAAAPAAAEQQQHPLLQVVPTPEGAPRDKLLLRDFIQNSLYHPTLGYFNAPTPPVGSMGGPINYWRIYCKDEYDIMVKKKYEELETSFLTPAELFSPWYGACIARHMVEHRKHHLAMEGQPLHIVEVGGGNGTLARDILDWLRANRPQDYQQTSYTCLEISTSLAARQYDNVVRKGGHAGRFHLRRGSGLDPATWGGERVWDHTFVLMMEVLDNLPHDRVFRRHASDPWQQTVIRPAASSTASASTRHAPSPDGGPPSLEFGPWVEAGEPVTDPLVRRTLAAVYKPPSREERLDERFNRVLDFILARDAPAASRDEVLWLPTAAAAFLELLHSLRPNHSLIAADFDKLPDVRLAGKNAPLIAQKVGGRNIDHDTLFVPWGTADIFFPTDFEALCALYKASAEHVWGGGGGMGGPAAGATAVAAAEGDVSDPRVGDVNAEHFRQGAVIKRYREMFNTATICAFNPMVDDFVNARFFFGDSKNRYPPGQERPAGQVRTRMPSAPASLASQFKSHIPAAPAGKVSSRSLQQQQKQQNAEPVLGGRRQRGGDGGVGGGRGRGPRG